jgi:hypothetical protein
MNESAVVSYLETNITEERINELSAVSAGLFPGAGPIAAIVGALVMRAVAAAKKYRDNIDNMPIVPPDLPSQLTYNDAVQFFQTKGLTGMFSEILAPAADPDNSDVLRARITASKAATAIKKCFDKDDALFNTVYAADMASGNYLHIWQTYHSFLALKASLQHDLAPASFKPMFDAVMEALTQEPAAQVKGSEPYKQVRKLVQDRIKKVVPGLDVGPLMDGMLVSLGDLSKQGGTT